MPERHIDHVPLPDPGPFDDGLWPTYLAVLVISMLGGIASFLRKVRAGHARPWNIPEFIGELTTSALVGLITFWLCQSANIDGWMSAALIGITSHMGTRAMFLFEVLLERKANSVLSVPDRQAESTPGDAEK